MNLEIFKTQSVLYAEDEEGISRHVGAILEIFFKKVYIARDGEEALELFYRHQPDVLVLDVCMPKLDGLMVLAQIREHDRKIPVIMITAHTEQPYLLRAVELNITKYLQKPFSKESLMESLRACEEYMRGWLGGELRVEIDESLSYNPSNKRLQIQEREIWLTKKESTLLEILLAKRGQVVGFDELINEVWGLEGGSRETLKFVIKEIRRKAGRAFIQNSFAQGYFIPKRG